MKKQQAVRFRRLEPRSDDMRRQALAALAKQDVAAAIGDLVRTDPVRAQLFLAMLKEAAESENRRAVVQVAADFGVLGSVIAEAFRPTALKARPARLADSWATVGRLIGSSMVKFGEQRDAHAG